MVYLVLKKIKNNVYAYLYKCTRTKGKPKQKYVSYLGNANGLTKKSLKNVKTKAEFNKLKKRKG